MTINYSRKIISFIKKNKYFGLRKIYYLLYYLTRSLLYLFIPPRIIYNLQIISLKERNRIIQNNISQLSKIKKIKAILHHGGPIYTPGISDIDWVIIFEKGKLNKKDCQLIARILKKNEYLCHVHSPLIVDEIFFNKLVKAGFFYHCYFNSYTILYNKNGLFRRPKISSVYLFYLLDTLEKFMPKNLCLQSMERNSFKKIKLRTIMKTINNRLLSLRIFETTFRKKALLKYNIFIKDSSQLKSLYSEYNEIKDLILRQNKYNIRIQYRIIDLFNKTTHYLDLYLQKLFVLPEFSALEKLLEGKNEKITIMNSLWGKAIFMKNFTGSQSIRNKILINFIRFFNGNLYDIKLYYYLLTLENISILQGLGRGIVKYIRLRNRFLWNWRRIITETGISDYIDQPRTLDFLIEIKKPLTITDKMTGKLLNFLVQ